jgi:hypothetical protein
MQHKKLVGLSVLLTLALLTTGLAYAQWSEKLTITGNVATAELDWELKNPASYLDHEGTKDWNADCNWNFWQLNKDVGGPTQITFRDTDGDGDYDTLEVTLVNTYPGYAESISFDVHNNGILPLIFKKVIINGNEFTSGSPMVSLDVTGDGKTDLAIKYSDNLGRLFNPSDSANVNFKILVLHDAPESSTLHFTIQLVAVQWNAP